MRNIKFESLTAMALLLSSVLYTACSSQTGAEETKQPGVHHMGSAPMSDAKMPGKVPDR
jgi:hypothetical protein